MTNALANFTPEQVRQFLSVADHASQAGIPWYFAVLFCLFVVLLVVGFYAAYKMWSWNMLKYDALAERLRDVETRNAELAAANGTIASQAVTALKEVAQVVRENTACMESAKAIISNHNSLLLQQSARHEH